MQKFEDKLAAESSTFASLKKDYDRERRTTTRTTYEVDFITYFTKLTELGAKFDKDAYLHPVEGVRLT
jgi:L-ascorbate peroxidase